MNKPNLDPLILSKYVYDYVQKTKKPKDRREWNEDEKDVLTASEFIQSSG